MEGLAVLASYKAPNPYVPLHKKLEPILCAIDEIAKKRRSKRAGAKLKKVAGAVGVVALLAAG
jgi:hypothetical protein